MNLKSHWQFSFGFFVFNLLSDEDMSRVYHDVPLAGWEPLPTSTNDILQQPIVETPSPMALHLLER